MTAQQKATVAASDLRAALRRVTPAVRPIFARAPVLTHVKVAVSGGVMTITASDLDMWIEARCRADGDVLPFTVRPGVLSALIRGASDPVTLSATPDRIVIGCGSVSAMVTNLIPAAYFPLTPGTKGDTKSASIKTETMRRALHATLPCVSKDGTRFYLQGVHFDTEGGFLTVVATDGHRLTIYDTADPWPLAPAILPAAAAKALLAMLPKGDNGALHITQSGDHLWIKQDSGHWSVYTKMIDGKYPEWRWIMPRSDRPEPIRVVIGAGTLSRLPPVNEAPTLIIAPDEGAITAKVEDQCVTFRVPADGEGEAFGLNHHYVRQMVRTLGTISLHGESPHEPFRIRAEDPGVRAVIMPMYIL